MRALLLILAATACSAQVVATVPPAQVDSSAAPGHLLPTASGQISILSNTTITARNITAHLTLTRGGSIALCQTTPIRITALPHEALLLALDRGALELRSNATYADTLLTPDMRLTPLTPGPLELDIHVSRNGDTCIDNRGPHAPTLALTDAFGQATYQLRPGQHVLFEHGSLKEVVDHETTPCGCPPPDPAPIPLAEALLRGGGKVTPAQAAAANPFPTAVSAGLAPPDPAANHLDPNPPIQVSTTLRFDPTAPAAPPAPAPVARQNSNPFRAIGHFFKRIFVR